MRLNLKITSWLRKKYNSFWAPKFRSEFVTDLPDFIPENKVFLVSEGSRTDTLVFKCPCGCKSNIFLNLLPDAKPRWKYKISKKGNISIYPSIWRRVGCKCHFIIHEGKIKWIK